MAGIGERSDAVLRTAMSGHDEVDRLHGGHELTGAALYALYSARVEQIAECSSR